MLAPKMEVINIQCSLLKFTVRYANDRRQGRAVEGGAGNYAMQGGCEDGSANPYTEAAEFHRYLCKGIEKIVKEFKMNEPDIDGREYGTHDSLTSQEALAEQRKRLDSQPVPVEPDSDSAVKCDICGEFFAEGHECGPPLSRHPATIPQPADGVVVPREPTEEILEAMRGVIFHSKKTLRQVYRAVLLAAAKEPRK